jgi:PAS domain S-box-containing protein
MEHSIYNKNKCILLVEDESLIALSESVVLENNGYKVIIAENGEQTIAAFRKDLKIDLILMDIDLGHGMDGTEAAETILKEHDIPLVFLSSHTEEEIVNKSRRITNYGYILKNTGETVLLASIDMAFKLHDANRRLRESEARYRLLAENSLDVIWTMDLTGRYTYISPSIFYLTGWTPEEAYRMSLEDYILPEYVSFFMDLLAHELSLTPDKRSRSKYMVFKQYRKDGSIIDVETNLAWTFDKDGNTVGIQGSSRDISSRKGMEEALRDSENKYRVIIENLNVVVFTLDREAIITYISSNVNRYGYDRDDVLGHHLIEFVHPDDHALVIDAYRRGIENGEEFHLEIRMLAKNGGMVRVLEADHNIRDETGAITQLVGFLWDITQRKQAEDALQKSEQQYRLLAENSTDVIWTMDLNGRFTYISPSVEKMTGWTQEEAMGLELKDYILPEYVEIIRKEIADELSKPASERTESKLIEIQQYAKNGSILHDEITVTWVYNEKGEIIGLQGSNRYINDRKQIEETLRISSIKYKALFESIPLGVAVSDKTGKILESNGTAERLLGLQREDIEKRRIDGPEWRIIKPDGFPMPPDEYASVIALKENRLVENVEMGIVKEDGDINWINVTAVPIPLEEYGVMIVYSDITKRIRAEKELLKVLNEKEALLHELQHRVKNSMALISALISIELNQMTDTLAVEVLMNIQNRIQSMATLYDLLYQTNDVKEIRLDRYLNQMGRVLQDTYTARQKKINLVISFDELSIDVKRAISIGLILNELLMNTFKHACIENKENKVLLNLKIDKKHAVIDVADNGPGLPQDFDPEQSSGMGLKIVRLLTDQLNGRMEYYSHEGVLFRITFPLESDR